MRTCAADCGQWLCYDRIDLSHLAPAAYEQYVNVEIAVDIYGSILASDGLGDPCLVANDVLPSRDDPCLPVAEESMSWGSLKGMYR